MYNLHNETLYGRIVKAKTPSQFSISVRQLIRKHLYKVVLPIEVRQEFVEGIIELYKEKFGESAQLENMLSDSLSEYYMQEDVRVISDRRYTGSQRPVCAKLEYPFDSVKMAKTRRDNPYRKESPVETIWDSVVPLYGHTESILDGGASSRTDLIDLKTAITNSDLTPLESELLWLSAVVGLTVREIADLSDEYPQKSVTATTIAKAKEKLRTQLGEENKKTLTD